MVAGMRRPTRSVAVPLIVAATCLCLVLADWFVGRMLSQRISETVACRLGVEDAQVELAGWPRSMPLVTQRFPRVAVVADGVPVGRMSARVELELSQVRRDQGRLSAGTASAVVAVPLTQLVDDLELGGRRVSVRGEDGRLVATVGPELFPVSMRFQVEERSGRLTLEPDGVILAGRTMTGSMADRVGDRILHRVGGGSGVGALLTEGLPLPVPASTDITEVSVGATEVEIAVQLDPDRPADLVGARSEC